MDLEKKFKKNQSIVRINRLDQSIPVRVGLQQNKIPVKKSPAAAPYNNQYDQEKRSGDEISAENCLKTKSYKLFKVLDM